MCLIISHRGYCNESGVIENTSAAMICAIRMGATAIEFDIHMAKCGTMLLFHNYSFDNNNTTYYITETTYDDIRSMIPSVETLDEFLVNIPRAIPLTTISQLTCVVDVKTSLFCDEINLFGTSLLDCLSLYRSRGFNFVTTSFNHSFVRTFVRTFVPTDESTDESTDEPIGVIIYHVPSKQDIEMSEFPEWIGTDHSQISVGLVDTMHRYGKKIFAYTPNTEVEIQKCINAGVDGIYTDELELAQRINGVNKTIYTDVI